MKQFGEAIERATAYCTYCPKLCRFSCPVAEAERRETVTPWGLMRLLEYARTGDVEFSEEVAETFYHCTGCARCETWCNHDNDVPQAMWAARARAHEANVLPKRIEGFSAEFLRQSSPHALPDFPKEILAECFDQDATMAFFPDCQTRRDPEKVGRAGLLLAHLLGSKVRLVTRLDGDGVGCCGSPLLAAGDQSNFQRHHAALKRALSGVEVLVTDCSSMVAQWRDPERWGASLQSSLPKLRHLIEVLDEVVEVNPPNAMLDQQSSMLLEGCLVSRHLELSDAIRRVLDVLFDQAPEDMSRCRDQETCCGAHGLYPRVDPQGSRDCAKELLEQVTREGGEALVCGSGQCAAHLGASAEDEDVAIDLLEAACLAYEIELSES